MRPINLCRSGAAEIDFSKTTRVFRDGDAPMSVGPSSLARMNHEELLRSNGRVESDKNQPLIDLQNYTYKPKAHLQMLFEAY
jgi:hypothetical protein